MKKTALNILLILFFIGLRAQEILPQSFPVILDNDTVLRITSGIGSLDAKARSEFVSNHLLKLAKEASFHIDSLKITQRKDNYFILHNHSILLTVTPEDTVITGKSQAITAEIYKASIGNAVQKYKESRSYLGIITRILIILGVFIVYYLMFRFLNYIFRKLRQKIITNKKWMIDFSIKNIVILDKSRFRRLISWVLRILKIIILIFLFYLTLPVIFSQFPVTANIAKILLNWVLSPVTAFFYAIVDFLPNLFAIIIIIIITRFIIKGIKFLSKEVENGRLELPNFHPEWANTTSNLIKVMVLIFAIVAIFPYIPGSDSKIFQGVSVFIGVILSLGSSSAISNIVAGIVITYMRPFKVGERIKIGDTVGIVVEKNLLITRIRTPKNEDITIPNSAVLSGNTVNYSKAANEAGVILYSTVTIGYDAPWRTVHQLLTGAAQATEGIEKEPQPFVLQTSLDDFYVSYQINAYTRLPDKIPQIYSDLHQNIQDKFNEGGIEIMSPHYKALRDGNVMAIPAEYLPENYVSPTFKVGKK